MDSKKFILIFIIKNWINQSLIEQTETDTIKKISKNLIKQYMIRQLTDCQYEKSETVICGNRNSGI